MQKRGEAARNQIKRTMLSYLLFHKNCSFSELGKVVDASRVTLYSLADELCASGIIRRDGERKLELDKSNTFVFLKFYDDIAEICFVRLSEAPSRTRLPFVPSMSREENIARIASIAERYVSELGFPVNAVLVNFADTFGALLPKTFSRSFDARDCVGDGFDNEMAVGTVLYIDGAGEVSVLCNDRKCIGCGKFVTDNIFHSLENLFYLCAPKFLLAKGIKTEILNEIEKMCRSAGVRLLALSEEQLSPDEVAAILSVCDEKIMRLK